MQEYRYIGINLSGRPLQGTIYAQNAWDFKKKLNELKNEHKISITQVQKKRVYTYKAVKANEKPVTGEQRAFSESEVQRALNSMGYQIIYIRKKLFDFHARVPVQDVVIFIRLCADMLRQKFPYDEILQLLANDTENKMLKSTIREIHKDLKLGKEGFQVFGRHSKVFGKFATNMLCIASTSGNMSQIYESTAKYLERDLSFKKSLRSALFMPMVVFIAVILTFLFYLLYIFPATSGLLTKYDIEIPPMTKASMAASMFLQHNILWIAALLIIPLVFLVAYFRSQKGRIVFHRLLIRLPVLGSLLHKSSIEIFSRVINALYSGSGENINVIKTASEACRNNFIEMRIKSMVIPAMLREGKTFTECLIKTGVFPANAINRFRSGEETGTMKDSAQQLADYYEREITYKMTRIIDWTNLNISIVVTILIMIITLISSEIGFVSPDNMSKNL